MAKETATQIKICNETFKRIEENLDYIKEKAKEHEQRSLERQPKFNQLTTDVEVIKTNVSNHLAHHTEIKQEFQWKTGLIIGLITFLVTLLLNIMMNWEKIRTVFVGN